MQSQGLNPTFPFNSQVLQRLGGLVPSAVLKSNGSGIFDFVKCCPEILPKLVHAVLPSLEEADEPLAVLQSRYQAATDFVQWLAYRGDFDEALRAAGQVSEAGGAGGVCGSVWGHNDIAYRCKSCEHDPTCAICVPCFLEGDHEGHDYSMIRTAGGCCDCGDPTAWKESGFCRKHKGPGSAPPLPEAFVLEAKPVLEQLCREWAQRLPHAGARLAADAQEAQSRTALAKEARFAAEATRAISKMLLRQASASEGLLNLISSVFADPTIGVLELLMKNEKGLTNSAVEASHALLYKLLGDPDFKYGFSRVFLKFYPQFLRDLQEEPVYPSNGQSILDQFSVQIFTVPTLTPHLVARAGLLDMLLETLREVMQAAAGSDGQIDISKAAVWSKHNRITGDLRYVLSHIESARYATTIRPELGRTWLRLLAYTQAMCPQKRQTQAHIEQENEDWSHAYLLEVQLGAINPLLVQGAASSRADAQPGPSAWDAAAFSPGGGEEARSARVFAEVGREDGGAGSSGPHTLPLDDVLSRSFPELKAHRINLPVALFGLLEDCTAVLMTCFAQDYMKGVGEGASVPAKTEWLVPLAQRTTEGSARSSTDPLTMFHLPAVASPVAQAGPGPVGAGDVRAGGLLGSMLRRRRFSAEEPSASGDAARAQAGVIGDVGVGAEEHWGGVAESEGFYARAFWEQRSPWGGEREWPVVAFDVGNEEVSFHIPVHRMFALLLHSALELFGMPPHKTLKEDEPSQTRQGPQGGPAPSGAHPEAAEPPERWRAAGVELRDLVPKRFRKPGVYAAVMEHPLRVAVLCSQVQAGMWRRNGHSMASLAELYHSVHWCEDSLELDIFLLQFCAVLAPPERFVESVQKRWGLSDYFSLDCSPPAEYEASLARDFLSFLIRIAADRTLCGFYPAEALRRELVQRLAVGDATHSSLIKSLASRLADSPYLPAVLADVALYSTPSGMQQGRYILKPECWRELDMHHPRWSPRELQRAEERYRQVLKGSAIAQQAPRWRPPFAAFAGLQQVVTSARVHDILVSIFHQALLPVPVPQSKAPDGVLHSALHLLWLALDSLQPLLGAEGLGGGRASTQPEAVLGGSGNEARVSSESAKCPLLAKAKVVIPMPEAGPLGRLAYHSLLSLLVHLLKKWGGAPISGGGGGGWEPGAAAGCGDRGGAESRSELADLVLRILRRFGEVDQECRGEVERLMEGEGNAGAEAGPASGEADGGEGERRRLLAKDRQAAALAQMKAAQEQFAAALGEDLSESEGEEDAIGGHSSARQEQPGSSSPAEAMGLSADGLTCVLCRESSSSASPLCYIVLVQRSKLLAAAEGPVPSWEKRLAQEPLGDPSNVVDAMVDEDEGPMSFREELDTVDLLRLIQGVLGRGGHITVEGPEGEVVMEGNAMANLLQEAAQGQAEVEWMEGGEGRAQEMDLELDDDQGALALDNEGRGQGRREGLAHEMDLELEDDRGALALDNEGHGHGPVQEEDADMGHSGGQAGMVGGVAQEEAGPSGQVHATANQWEQDAVELLANVDRGWQPQVESRGDAVGGGSSRGSEEGPEGSRGWRGASGSGIGGAESQQGGPRSPARHSEGWQTQREAEEAAQAVLAWYVEAAQRAGQGRGGVLVGAARGREGDREWAGGAADGPLLRTVRRRGTRVRGGVHAGAAEEQQKERDVGLQLMGCGHALHQTCFDRYFSSLLQRYLSRASFEGANIVDPQVGEFLCPMCRRLANATLPAFPPWAQQGQSCAPPGDVLNASPSSPLRAGLQSILAPSPSLKAALRQDAPPTSAPRPAALPRAVSGVQGRTCRSCAPLVPVSSAMERVREGIAIMLDAEIQIRSPRFCVNATTPLPARLEEAVEAFGGRLCQMTQPARDEVASLLAGRTHQGLRLWEALWYTVASADLAARGGARGAPLGRSGHVLASTPRTAIGLQLPSVSARLTALGSSVDAQKGSIVPALAALAVARRSHSEQAVLLRARGMQMLVGALLWGLPRDGPVPGLSERNMASIAQASSPLVALRYIEQNSAGDDVIFWRCAADPVLANDAFATLARILYCLPGTELPDAGTFAALVNLVYLVCVTQAIARLARAFPVDLPGLSAEGRKVLVWIASMTDSLPGIKRYGATTVGTPPPTPDALLALIRRHTLPYLRRCALLQHLLLGNVQAFAATPTVAEGHAANEAEGVQAGEAHPDGSRVPFLHHPGSPPPEFGQAPCPPEVDVRNEFSTAFLGMRPPTSPSQPRSRASLGLSITTLENEASAGREEGNLPPLSPMAPPTPHPSVRDAGAREQATAELEEAGVWEQHFALPTLPGLLDEGPFFSLAVRWLKGALQTAETRGIHHLALPGTAAPFELLQLPHRFHDLFQRFVKERCQHCGLVPEQPALCLLCGAFCCGTRQGTGESNRSGCGEAFRHVRNCGAGIGIFLMLRRSSVLLLRGERYAMWASPYLDAYGEEDENLQRGKPLFLNPERYAALTTLVASHGLDHSSAVLSQTSWWPMF